MLQPPVLQRVVLGIPTAACCPRRLSALSRHWGVGVGNDCPAQLCKDQEVVVWNGKVFATATPLQDHFASPPDLACGPEFGSP